VILIWKIEFQRAAVKQLGALTKSDANRIVSFLTDRIARDGNPRRTGAALQGSELGNFWRYRWAITASSAIYRITSSSCWWSKSAIAVKSTDRHS
jgi:mRNA interferase RelE/StbE